MEFVEEAGKESAAQRRRAALVVRLLVEFFKDALAVSVGAAPRADSAEELRLLGDLARRVSPEQIVAVIDRCLDADIQNERYVQTTLLVEALLDALGRVVSG
jgi:DNA polymerase-3 subunit delta'